MPAAFPPSAALFHRCRSFRVRDVPRASPEVIAIQHITLVQRFLLLLRSVRETDKDDSGHSQTQIIQLSF